VIGAVVLVALAVIFVPMVLEGPDEEPVPQIGGMPDYADSLAEEERAMVEDRLPLPPEPVRTVILDESSPPSASERESPPDESTEPVAAQTETQPVPEGAQAVEPAAGAGAGPEPAAPEPAAMEETVASTAVAPAPVAPPPAKPETQAPGAWVVQVGSFQNKANALGLQDRLRKAGFDGFVERVQLDSGVRYRVRVGPELERENAENLLARLESELKLGGQVMSHP
jgi:DedD protein